MDWTLFAACIVMAWALLLILSGERARRMRELEIEKLRKEAAEKSAFPTTL